ncbi:MAG TPA: hypothetical protein VFG83_16585 [Kofleriaceae bacterium]|nr:hypothetical protein [Kofleriaceae bacterium]
MSPRRLLLIDVDPTFSQMLKDHLGPYGFEVHAVTDSDNPLSQVGEVEPEIIFIAVELPDKVGYSLCNKAKKGVAKDIPVVLTTSTVPPSGFKSHRKLRVHADEYLDKRTMTAEELCGKVETLVSLGLPTAFPPPSKNGKTTVDSKSVWDSLAADDAVELSEEELFMDDIDVELDVEGFETRADSDVEGAVAWPANDFDEGESTQLAPPQIFGAEFSAEADAALAAIDDDLFDVGAGGETQVAVTPVAIPAEPPPAPTNAAHDAGFCQWVNRAPSPPLPEDENDGVPEAIPDWHEVSEPNAADSALDLGLDEVAAAAAEETASPQPADSAELSRENERLRSEIARLQATATDGGDGFSRERQFLSLREVINKKEKAILDLQAEVSAKERQILENKEAIHHLESARADIDSKALKLEQTLLEAGEKLAAIERRAEQLEAAAEAEKQAFAEARAATEAEHFAALEAVRAQAHQEGAERLQARERELSAEAQATLAALADEHAGILEGMRAAHGEAIEAARAELAASAEAERAAALEAAEQARNEALAAARSEAEAALLAVRAEHETAHQALEDQHAGHLARVERERDEAITAAEERRAAELAAAEERRANELAAAEERRAGELAAAAAEMATKLDEAEQRRAAEVAAAEERRTNELAAAAAELAAKLEQAEQRRAGELAAAAEDLSSRLAEAEARRASELAAAAEERAAAENHLQDKFESARAALEEQHNQALAHGHAVETELGTVKDYLARREGELSEAQAKVATQAAEIERLRNELAEVESANTGYQEQILRAHQKIKRDDALVSRAKKAVSVALTLLDDTAQPPDDPADATEG